MKNEIHYAKFDARAEEAVGFYVYALRDPRTKNIFYIGKGQGNRWYDHIHEARVAGGEVALKLQRIREIELSGEKVEVFLLRSQISSERVAYEVEGAVLHALRLLQRGSGNSGFDLTNLAEAHHPERGLMSVEVVQSIHNAPACPDIDIPCGIFKINRRWYPEMSDVDILESTAGWWTYRSIKRHKDAMQYALGVSDGIIRATYRVEPTMWRPRTIGDRDWEHDLGKEPRWGFPSCIPAPELSRFLNTSVAHLFRRGNAHPVTFYNC